MNKNDEKDENNKSDKLDKVKIYTRENIRELREIPILTDDIYNSIWIYVLLNNNNQIKIGKTTNIVQRITSLSGSNGGGSKLTHIYVSPIPTVMQSVEGTIHNHFNYCRILGTEWFDGDKASYEEVVEYVDKLFRSADFEKCNEVRKQFIESKRIKGEISDHKRN